MYFICFDPAIKITNDVGTLSSDRQSRECSHFLKVILLATVIEPNPFIWDLNGILEAISLVFAPDYPAEMASAYQIELCKLFW